MKILNFPSFLKFREVMPWTNTIEVYGHWHFNVHNRHTNTDKNRWIFKSTQHGLHLCVCLETSEFEIFYIFLLPCMTKKYVQWYTNKTVVMQNSKACSSLKYNLGYSYIALKSAYIIFYLFYSFFFVLQQRN